jgi:small conductance mechanosensitive channel
MDLSNFTARLYELATVYGLRIIYAIVIFIIGRWIAKGVANLIRRILTKSKTDGTLVSLFAI